jgi:ABC-2 type transport system ATP-binding protein
MLSAVNLRKSFGAIQAVNGLSLELEPGETFGLLGPNGAGKTTTIHMLVGALRPDHGTVSIAGVPDPTRAEVRRLLGLAPQIEALYEELTGQENLTFFARLYGLAGNHLRERVSWALELAGLKDRRRDRVKGYSGGMKRRLNLACAMVHDPKVLFLDEPTAGVDPQSRSHILASIEQLARMGRTILYTTHYMEEAERLCDRVAIMDHGKILALDTVPNLLTKHGGRATVEAELAQPAPAGLSLPETCNGLHWRFQSSDAFEEAARLRAAGVQFASLHIERPNLETVFLSLTGRRLRD